MTDDLTGTLGGGDGRRGDDGDPIPTEVAVEWSHEVISGSGGAGVVLPNPQPNEPPLVGALATTADADVRAIADEAERVGADGVTTFRWDAGTWRSVDGDERLLVEATADDRPAVALDGGTGSFRVHGTSRDWVPDEYTVDEWFFDPDGHDDAGPAVRTAHRAGTTVHVPAEKRGVVTFNPRPGTPDAMWRHVGDIDRHVPEAAGVENPDEAVGEIDTERVERAIHPAIADALDLTDCRRQVVEPDDSLDRRTHGIGYHGGR